MERFIVKMHKYIAVDKALYVIIILFISCSVSSFCQRLKPIEKRMRFHAPELLFNAGDTISFFPFNDDYKGNYTKGYTCFYDIKSMDSGFKPKYRFKVDDNKMTPLDEIENNSFYVKSINTRDFNKKNKLYYSAILERISDRAEVCFAFPAGMKNEPQESVLHSWIKFHNESSYNVYGKNCLVIPFHSKHLVDEMKRLEGRIIYLSKKYDIDAEDYLLLSSGNAEGQTKHLNSLEIGHEFVAGKVIYIGTSNALIYSHLFLPIYDIQDSMRYYIPVTHFVGNCKSEVVMREKEENLFTKHFTDKENSLSYAKQRVADLDTLIGKTYYFRYNYDYDKNKSYYNVETRCLDEKRSLYDLKYGYYKCVGLEWLHTSSWTESVYAYYAVLEDSAGIRFQFPATSIRVKYGDREYPGHKDLKTFTDIFIPKAKQDDFLKRKAAEKAEVEEKIAKYEAKYHDKSLAIALAVGSCTEERYLMLRKKYGAKKAALMARKNYSIGWSYDEVRESIGNEYFECVHTYENRLGYYERYQLRRYEPSFLTFKNGILISISN